LHLEGSGEVLRPRAPDDARLDARVPHGGLDLGLGVGRASVGLAQRRGDERLDLLHRRGAARLLGGAQLDRHLIRVSHPVCRSSETGSERVLAASPSASPVSLGCVTWQLPSDAKKILEAP
jgi:hypothetical protein